jgi:molecular chaperone GrpE (heat shock protein)
VTEARTTRPAGDALSEAIDELTEDMVHVITALRTVDGSQGRVLERIAALEAVAGENSRQIARQLDTLRRELVGDRAWTAHTQVFQVLAPLADQVTAMRAGLDPADDDRLMAQLAGITSALEAALRGLGFESFGARPGEVFEPARMECLGHAAGESGVVLRGERAGYRAGDVVVRPAGVIVGEC